MSHFIMPTMKVKFFFRVKPNFRVYKLPSSLHFLSKFHFVKNYRCCDWGMKDFTGFPQNPIYGRHGAAAGGSSWQVLNILDAVWVLHQRYSLAGTLSWGSVPCLGLFLSLFPVDKHIFLCHTFLAPWCSAHDLGSKILPTNYAENVHQNKYFLNGLRSHFVFAEKSPPKILIYKNLKM